MSSLCSSRILKDLKEVSTSINIDTPSCYASLDVGDDSMSSITAMIVGPYDTPYEGGFFEFKMKFPNTYPNKPPHCEIITNDNQTVRFNPNLYSNGKVCLSILGTWRGESADEWRPSYSILYILQAIQALIMNPKPYHNEPGFETSSNDSEVRQYSEKIQHETIRVAVCNQIQRALSDPSFSPFSSEMKNQFLMYYPNYIQICEKNKVLNGSKFYKAAFEFERNSAMGEFDYSDLISKLQCLKVEIQKETDYWKENGLSVSKQSDNFRSMRLLREFGEIESGENFIEGLSVGLVNENPFYWSGSFMPSESSMLDGGIFNFEIVFDNEESIRFKFLTELFNPHVNVDGVPFYRMSSSASPVFNTLSSIVKILSDRPNPNSTSWLNKEAADLYFSHDNDKKKEYKKLVSRCVRRSIEA